MSGTTETPAGVSISIFATGRRLGSEVVQWVGDPGGVVGRDCAPLTEGEPEYLSLKFRASPDSNMTVFLTRAQLYAHYEKVGAALAALGMPVYDGMEQVSTGRGKETIWIHRSQARHLFGDRNDAHAFLKYAQTVCNRLYEVRGGTLVYALRQPPRTQAEMDVDVAAFYASLATDAEQPHPPFELDPRQARVVFLSRALADLFIQWAADTDKQFDRYGETVYVPFGVVYPQSSLNADVVSWALYSLMPDEVDRGEVIVWACKLPG